MSWRTVQEPYTADAAGLLRFLEGEILPWYAMRRTELANRPLICAQAFGEALDPDRLERLGRYEVHLGPQARTHAHHTDPVAKPAADRRPRLIRFAKLLLARVFPAEPYAGEQGQHGWRGIAGGDIPVGTLRAYAASMGEGGRSDRLALLGDPRLRGHTPRSSGDAWGLY